VLVALLSAGCYAASAVLQERQTARNRGAGATTLAQLAYRDGQLGGPLATITLVEPLIAGILGVTVLGERLELTPVPAVLGPAGLVSTALGVCALSRPGPLAGEAAAARSCARGARGSSRACSHRVADGVPFPPRQAQVRPVRDDGSAVLPAS
jgi:hypothetical protein